MRAIRAALLLLAAGALAQLAAAEGATVKGNHPPGFSKPEPDEVVRLWPGDAPGLVAGGKAETFANERYANVSVPLLSVYRPSAGTANGTALIICAGGGYNHLAMCLHVENVVAPLTARGITVFGLKYRTRYGANDVVADALADGQRAVRLVRSRAAAWGVDPRRVGVQGYSAGANLCLGLICRFDAGDAQAADPLARASSRPDFCALMSPWPGPQRGIDGFPIPKDAPPTFVASARDDTTAPFAFAQAIDDRLKQLQVAELFLAVETGNHAAFHYGMSDGPGARWPETLLPWLTMLGMLR
jgi:acetyl esterase/lipase